MCTPTCRVTRARSLLPRGLSENHVGRPHSPPPAGCCLGDATHRPGVRTKYNGDTTALLLTRNDRDTNEKLIPPPALRCTTLTQRQLGPSLSSKQRDSNSPDMESCWLAPCRTSLVGLCSVSSANSWLCDRLPVWTRATLLATSFSISSRS
jgi:hypothetical protein